MSKLRVDYVRLRCERCRRTLDWYFKDGSGVTFSPAYLRKRHGTGPNGRRVTYTCKCGAEHVLLLARLLPLVPEAAGEMYGAGASIVTNYEISPGRAPRRRADTGQLGSILVR